MKYCNGASNKREVCIFTHLCKAHKLDCTTTDDIECSRMVYSMGEGEYCVRDDIDNYDVNVGCVGIYVLETDGHTGYTFYHDDAERISRMFGARVAFISDKRELIRIIKHIDLTSLYNRCLMCPLAFKDWGERGECSLHWRPYSGTKYGFPKDDWHCPLDTFVKKTYIHEDW